MEPLSTLIATSVLGEVFKTIGKKLLRPELVQRE